MAFKVAARTIIELGAELISSDAIALYELIKNAYDARSRRAQISIQSVFRYSALRDTRQRIVAARIRVRNGDQTESQAVDAIRRVVIGQIDGSAPTEIQDDFRSVIADAETLNELRDGLASAYDRLNRIDIADTGDGMSLDELDSVFLTIGTTSRLRGDRDGVPYAGGKGIGRLSAMRLGDVLEVRSTKRGESSWNRLDIDWQVFTHTDQEDLEDIEIAPFLGRPKSDPDRQGTRLRIRGLKADWDQARVKRLVSRYFDRLFDPFQGRPRYPLIISVNGVEVDIPAFDREVLQEAQAKATISYTTENGPRLSLDIEYLARGRTTVEVWDETDILGITSGEDISVAALRSLGPFEASFHWFNRQRIKGIEGYGDRNQVRDTVNAWANGLLMYRDGFRVNPYGNPDDDWLGIDTRALSSAGYKVNRKQLVGGVYITSRGNPELIDQTNREGLRANEEKTLLILLLRKAITENFKRFLNDVEKEERKSVRMDAAETSEYLETVSVKVRNAMKTLRNVTSQEHRSEIVLLESTFSDLQRRLIEARNAIASAERDQKDLVDLAGVGLQVEIVAHELSRVTRHTLEAIGSLEDADLPERVVDAFESIASQMLVMRRRLDVLDPLGPNSRNSKKKIDLGDLVATVMSSHEDQFARYGIEAEVKFVGGEAFQVRGVEGMLVQVLENLLDNAVFWLRQKLRAEPDFGPEILVEIDTSGREVRITDNGPGVPADRADEIFKPFVSFKPPGSGKGLGLYISREIARRHSSDLYMADDPDDQDRLHTFVLDIDGF
jgi:signal transduction histidine kinase